MFWFNKSLTRRVGGINLFLILIVFALTTRVVYLNSKEIIETGVKNKIELNSKIAIKEIESIFSTSSQVTK